MLQTPAARTSLPLRGRLIAFDTNILLNLYRRHPSSADAILADLLRLNLDLHLPGQVQREFWSNRDSVLKEVRDSSAVQELAAAQRVVQKALKAATRWDIDPDQGATLRTLADDTFQKLRTEAAGSAVKSKNSATARARVALVDPGNDPVLSGLNTLFAGRTGAPLNAQDRKLMAKVAEERFALNRPPGYEDSTKVDGGYGDFFIWEELVSLATERHLPVILVTNDVKEDWWRLVATGEPINARYELVEEMQERAGVEFHTLTFDDFLAALTTDPDSELQESAVEDSDPGEANTQAVDAEDRWTAEEYDLLYLRLIESGYTRQAEIVELARRTPSGVLTRQQVLNELGLDEEAKLTGFTRPLRRSQAALVQEGTLRPNLPWAFVAGYDGPGKAQRFSVPKELTELPQ